MAQDGFDPKLVLRAQKGDKAAVEFLLKRLAPIFRSFFLRRVGDAFIVDDLVQNALLRIHARIGVLKDPSRLKAFAMKGALFELHDLYRGRYGPKERLFVPEELPQRPDQVDEWAGSKIDVERVLSVLTPHARRIIELREYGYRYKEIAEILDTTETAVKMQVKRAFERMREVFAS